jgi:hypothetical protein
MPFTCSKGPGGQLIAGEASNRLLRLRWPNSTKALALAATLPVRLRGRCDEWHLDIEFTPFAIKLDNLDHHHGFQVCLG